MRRTKQFSRHQARKRALDVLYQSDLRDRPVSRVLSTQLADPDPPPEFAVQLVRGVNRRQHELDELIQSHSREWKLSRMPIIDRNLLRIGLYEILFSKDVPTAVAIDEAVELAKELSTDDSGRFVNGLLARIAQSSDGDDGSETG